MHIFLYFNSGNILKSLEIMVLYNLSLELNNFIMLTLCKSFYICLDLICFCKVARQVCHVEKAALRAKGKSRGQEAIGWWGNEGVSEA